MNLKYLTNSELHLQTKNSVLQEKTSTLKVLKFIEEVHRRKLFIDLGHATLIKYMVLDLGYTGAEAWVRVQAMKMMSQVPAIEEKVEKGLMSLTNVALLSDAIRKSDTEVPPGFDIIEPIKKPSRQDIITKALDNSDLPSRKFKELMDLEPKEKKIILNERILKKMSKIIGYMTEIELIESLCDEKIKNKSLAVQLIAPNKQSSNSRYIPRSVQRFIFARSSHQCEYVSESGQRCLEKRNLQMDHIHPYALGGHNSEENMRILCSGHNQARAFKTFSL